MRTGRLLYGGCGRAMCGRLFTAKNRASRIRHDTLPVELRRRSLAAWSWCTPIKRSSKNRQFLNVFTIICYLFTKRGSPAGF